MVMWKNHPELPNAIILEYLTLLASSKTHPKIWQQVHDSLREPMRQGVGKTAQPSAASLDSQSVKTTEKREPARCGGFPVVVTGVGGLRLRRSEARQRAQTFCPSRYLGIVAMAGGIGSKLSTTLRWRCTHVENSKGNQRKPINSLGGSGL